MHLYGLAYFYYSKKAKKKRKKKKKYQTMQHAAVLFHYIYVIRTYTHIYMHCCGHWCAPLRRFIRVHRRVKFIFFERFASVRSLILVHDFSRSKWNVHNRWLCILGIPFNQMQLQTANTMKALKSFPKADLHHANNKYIDKKPKCESAVHSSKRNESFTHSLIHPFAWSFGIR